MINRIKKTNPLKAFTTQRCEENELFVSMAVDIPETDYLVIKVDNYYNSLRLTYTPPSVDCLIPLKCLNNDYIIYLIELKNIKKPAGFDIKNIHDKFKTTIENFMGSRFKKTFHNEHYSIRVLRLYFVTSAYRGSERVWRKEGLKIDVLQLQKPFKFQGKRYQIKYKSPNPLIERC